MQLLGKAHDKEFWKQLRASSFHQQRISDLKKAYAEFLEKDKLESFKYSEFKLFWTTGNRSVYRTKLQERREYMRCAFILSLIYPEEQEYLDNLMDIIYAVCDEYTWCQPAHQGKLEPNNNTRIDLSASVLSNWLAEIYVLLEDRLEPLIKNRILAEIDRRIIEPFTSVDDYGWWEMGDTNWTAVCMGNVASTVMLLRPELADDKFIDRSVRSMQAYLTGFDNDGICYEGVGYWSYGFSNFAIYADILRKFTNGKIDFFSEDKVRKIATFHQKTFLSGNKCVSFSDGGLKADYLTYLMHFLKNEYPDDVLVYDPKYGTSDHSLIRGYTWTDERIHNSPAPHDTEFEMFAPEANWMIKKTAAYGFAAKGGCNAEPHNHNDVGNFSFVKNQKHVIADIGGGVYTRQYFTRATRYEQLECRSGGHSLPLIDGCEQTFGKEFCATDFKYENGVLSMDIATAYQCPELRSLRRTFELGQDQVKLTDKFEYTGSGKLISRLISVEQVDLTQSGEIRIADATVIYDPTLADCSVSEEISSNGLKVRKIDFILKNGVREFSCTVR